MKQKQKKIKEENNFTQDQFDKIVLKYDLQRYTNDLVHNAVLTICRDVGTNKTTSSEGQKRLDLLVSGQHTEWSIEVQTIVGGLRSSILESRADWVRNFDEFDKDKVYRFKMCTVFVRLLTCTEGVAFDFVVNKIGRILAPMHKELVKRSAGENESSLYAFSHILVSALVCHNKYLDLKAEQESPTVTVTKIYPSKYTLSRMEGSLDKIGKKYPALVCPRVTAEGLGLSSSFRNQGITKYTDCTLKAANRMAGVKYRINKRYLAYLIEERADLIDLGANVVFSDFAGKTLRQACRELHLALTEYKIKLDVLNIAIAYRHLDYFYFDVKCDWRGRFYSLGDSLNYQGAKIGLALLEFYKPGEFKTKDVATLKIYGAELLGFKGCFTTLIKKFDGVEDQVIGLDPALMRSKGHIFRAFAIEYSRLIKGGPGIKTRFPILVDCSCSGIQHLAAMLADKEMGIRVNLMPSGGPQDIYSIILRHANVNLVRAGLNLNRTHVKRCIMTVPYNASVRTMASSIAESLVYHDGLYRVAPGEAGVSYKDIYKIAKNINEIFYKMHDKLKLLVTYLNKMAKLMAKLNLPVTWVTPIGVQITQDYRMIKVGKIRAYANKPIAIAIPTDFRCGTKQAAGLMPNIIHSLDGENVARTVVKSDADMLTIHDCFGGVLSDIEGIQQDVRDGFVAIYTKRDFIRKFHLKCMIDILACHQVSDGLVTCSFSGDTFEIPRHPELGDLVIEEILKANYMVT